MRNDFLGSMDPYQHPRQQRADVESGLSPLYGAQNVLPNGTTLAQARDRAGHDFKVEKKLASEWARQSAEDAIARTALARAEAEGVTGELAEAFVGAALEASRPILKSIEAKSSPSGLHYLRRVDTGAYFPDAIRQATFPESLDRMYAIASVLQEKHGAVPEAALNLSDGLYNFLLLNIPGAAVIRRLDGSDAPLVKQVMVAQHFGTGKADGLFGLLEVLKCWNEIPSLLSGGRKVLDEAHFRIPHCQDAEELAKKATESMVRIIGGIDERAEALQRLADRRLTVSDFTDLVISTKLVDAPKQRKAESVEDFAKRSESEVKEETNGLAESFRTAAAVGASDDTGFDALATVTQWLQRRKAQYRDSADVGRNFLRSFDGAEAAKSRRFGRALLKRIA